MLKVGDYVHITEIPLQYDFDGKKDYHQTVRKGIVLGTAIINGCPNLDWNEIVIRVFVEEIVFQTFSGPCSMKVVKERMRSVFKEGRFHYNQCRLIYSYSSEEMLTHQAEEVRRAVVFHRKEIEICS